MFSCRAWQAFCKTWQVRPEISTCRLLHIRPLVSPIKSPGDSDCQGFGRSWPQRLYMTCRQSARSTPGQHCHNHDTAFASCLMCKLAQKQPEMRNTLCTVSRCVLKPLSSVFLQMVQMMSANGGQRGPPTPHQLTAVNSYLLHLETAARPTSFPPFSMVSRLGEQPLRVPTLIQM